MIIFQQIVLTPDTVNVGNPFLLAVSLYELVVPTDYIMYAGTFYAGEQYCF